MIFPMTSWKFHNRFSGDHFMKFMIFFPLSSANFSICFVSFLFRQLFYATQILSPRILCQISQIFLRQIGKVHFVIHIFPWPIDGICFRCHLTKFAILFLNYLTKFVSFFSKPTCKILDFLSDYLFKFSLFCMIIWLNLHLFYATIWWNLQFFFSFVQ